MDEFKNQEAVVEEGITFSELLGILWKNKAIVFLVTLWVFVIGFIYTYVVVDPVYSAETSIMVQVDVTNSSVSEQSAIVIAQNLIATYKEFVVSDLVLNAVIADLDGLPADYSLAALKQSITVTSATSVLIIYIMVENTGPELAQEIANALVVQSIAIANDEEAGYVLLQDKLKTLDVATNPVNPSSPNKPLNLVISFLIGAILSFGIIFIRELFNNKFQSTMEMEKYLGINVIAAVPGTIKERKMVE